MCKKHLQKSKYKSKVNKQQLSLSLVPCAYFTLKALWEQVFSLIDGRKLTIKQKLITSIKNQELTNCLELLEELGFTGDLAIFILANLQYEVAA